MTDGAGQSGRLGSGEYRQAIGHFVTGVTVITSEDAEGPVGTTASSVSSVSADPPMVLVCLDQGSRTGRAVAGSGRFAINVLHTGQEPIATRLASKDPNKLAGVELNRGSGGNPVLPGALAQLECSVTQTLSAGTHTIFLAEVSSAAVGSEQEPLAYFRGRFARITDLE